MLGIPFVGERHDGVNAVIAAIELNDHKHPTIPLSFSGACGLRQKGGNGRGQGEKR